MPWVVAGVATLAASLGLILFPSMPEFAGSFALFAAVSTIAAWWGYKQASIFSWQFVIPAYYLTYFSILPALEQMLSIKNYLHHYAPAGSGAWAYILATVGIVSFVAATCIEMRARRPSSVPKVRTGVPKLYSLHFVVTLFILGVAGQLWSFFFGYYGLLPVDFAVQPSALAGPMTVLAQLCSIANAIAWTQIFYTKRISSAWRLLAGLSSVFLVCLGLFANSKGALLIPLTIVLVAASAHRRRVTPYAAVAGLLFYAFVAFPIVNALRQDLGVLGVTRTQHMESVSVYVRSGVWASSEYSSYTSDVIASLSRAMFGVFETIVDQTPQRIEYANGATYLALVSAAVPRAILPDKANLNLGNAVGQFYGFVDPMDTSTNVSVSQMGEMYINFGPAGIILGMFIWGLAAARLDRTVFSRRGDGFMVWLYASSLGWHESFLAHTLVPFAKVVLCFWVLSWMARASRLVAVAGRARPPMSSTAAAPARRWV